MTTRSILLSLTLLTSLLQAEEWRTFTSSNGKSFLGVVLEKTDDQIPLKRKADGKTFTLPLAKFSPSDQTYILNWKPSNSPLPVASGDKDLPKSLFPKTRSEIATTLAEISKRKSPPWASENQSTALNNINIYRYLAGLPAEVTIDKGSSEEVKESLGELDALGSNPITPKVAEKVKGILRIPHGDLIRCVQAAIRAGGSGQERSRVTRRKLLSPGLTEVGLNEFSTRSGILPDILKAKSKQKFWTYPSYGFYPKEMLHGNTWSYYGKNNLDPEEIPEVKIYRLDGLPTKKLNPKKIEGIELQVRKTFVYLNSVIFEPLDPETNKHITGPGIYGVVIKGSVKASYVVALY